MSVSTAMTLSTTDGDGVAIAVTRASARSRTRAAVLEHLQRADGISRAELARELGYSPSTITTTIGELLAEGRVEQYELPSALRRVGRPALGLRVRLDGRLLGVEFDHDRVHVAVADSDGTVILSGVRAVDTGRTATHAIGVAAQLCRDILSRTPYRLDSILAAAVGLPGPVDITTGIVGSSSVLPHWQHVNVAHELRRRLGRISVQVDNDANLAARGEALRSANFLYVKASTGLGAAVYMDGRALRGTYGAAGELGHITVPGETFACRCGNQGCLETISSTPALIRRVAESHPGTADLAAVRELATTDPALVHGILVDMGSTLGIHLAHLCTMLDIDQVIIGGELTDFGTAYIDGARRTARRWVHPELAPKLRVARSALGARAGLTGALVAARHLAASVTRPT